MAEITLTPLWTDWMIWGLVAAFAYLGFLIRRSQQVRAQWLGIFESKLAMSSAIILLGYLTIALLDSIHYQTPSMSGVMEYKSALDGV